MWAIHPHHPLEEAGHQEEGGAQESPGHCPVTLLVTRDNIDSDSGGLALSSPEENDRNSGYEVRDPQSGLYLVAGHLPNPLALYIHIPYPGPALPTFTVRPVPSWTGGSHCLAALSKAFRWTYLGILLSFCLGLLRHHYTLPCLSSEHILCSRVSTFLWVSAWKMAHNFRLKHHLVTMFPLCPVVLLFDVQCFFQKLLRLARTAPCNSFLWR